MREFILELIDHTNVFGNSNISSTTIFVYLSRWLHNGCFSFYRADVCKLNIEDGLEVAIKLPDFLTVWILLLVLFAFSIFGFAYEYLRGY